MAHQITCITREDRSNPYDRITHIGGTRGGELTGGQWKITQHAAIRGIESGHWSFYVSQRGKTVEVIVAKTGDGYRYLKAEADGDEPNNLLSLPECP